MTVLVGYVDSYIPTLLTQVFPLYRNIYDPAVVCLQDLVKTCGTSPNDVEVQEWAEITSKILTYICSEQGLRGMFHSLRNITLTNKLSILYTVHCIWIYCPDSLS